MQIEKYYKAQELRKDIIEVDALIKLLSESNSQLLNEKLLNNLNVELRATLTDKAVDVVKKELAKIIKQLEKDFSAL